MSLCALLSGAAPSSSLPNCQQLVVREMVCFPVSDSGPEDGTVYLLSPSAFLSEWLVAALSLPAVIGPSPVSHFSAVGTQGTSVSRAKGSCRELVLRQNMSASGQGRGRPCVLLPWPGKRVVTLDPDLANQSAPQFQIMTTSL